MNGLRSLILGIVFGFLLHRAGLTEFEKIIGQLLLEDFTVIRVMVTAIIVGMAGVEIMVHFNLVKLHPKHGSLGSTVFGGLIFGAGFAILGYCPGTVVAAAGSGKLDALLAGIPGMIAGAGLFAHFYPGIHRKIMHIGNFGQITIPELLGIARWKAAAVIATFLTIFLFVARNL